MVRKKQKAGIDKAAHAGIERWRKRRPGADARKTAERLRVVIEEGDGAAETDPGVRHIEGLMETALGKAWLADDPWGDGDGEPPLPPQMGVVAPLPRRDRIGSPLDQTQSVPPMMRGVEFSTTIFQTVLRIFVWYWAMFRYMALVSIDTLRGKRKIEHRAIRMREVLESLGPTFIKLGQQLALRADLLPYEYCAELGKLLDSVEPFSTEYAIAEIEQVTGRPIGESFAVFDPTPIGSASLACVYQAIRHDGTKVAVKVRRPDIHRILCADINAMDWMLRLAEGLTFQKPGSTKGLRYDMKAMLLEELNFWTEARSTDLFRRRAEEMRPPVVTAPRVHFDLSGETVVVTEFVAGVFLFEVLNAIDRKDEDALAYLRDLGYDPHLIASNLMLAFNWETLEGLLFHADPHPANIVVKPDNTLVFIDFGSCGRASDKTRRIYTQFYNHIVREDVGAMVESTLAMLEPLPPIDIDAFSKELEAVYWDWLYALKSENSEWWEKATGVIWVRITDISRRYAISMNLDTLRQFRATFLYDTIMYRLYDGLDFDREMLKYFKRVGRRARKDVKKSVKRRLKNGFDDTDFLVLQEATRMMAQMASVMQRFIDKPRHSFSALVDKAAYSFRMVIQLFVIFGVLHAGSILSHWAYNKVTGHDVVVEDTISNFLNHPLYQVFLYGVLLLVLRKILLRLGDVDIRG